MAQKKSAGILVYRVIKKSPEFFLVHPGGPIWKNKDAGAWSIPKGEYADNEDPLTAAKREFSEETSQSIEGNFIPLTPVKQKSGKHIYAWAVEGNPDTAKTKSNLFEMEWPPRSGKKQQFPEIDKAEWFSETEAKFKINPAQASLIDQLLTILKD